MKKEIITTDKAPAAIGPYSQAVKMDNLLFTSGMIPIVPATGQVVEGGVSMQAEQVLNNLQVLLESAGTSMDNVLKTTVFIKNMDDFSTINEVYKRYFTGCFPARSCVEVARLPKDVLVEIECVAVI
jgi:2-iminobutanoate/2-iminopropanoate deaminase